MSISQAYHCCLSLLRVMEVPMGHRAPVGLARGAGQAYTPATDCHPSRDEPGCHTGPPRDHESMIRAGLFLLGPRRNKAPARAPGHLLIDRLPRSTIERLASMLPHAPDEHNPSGARPPDPTVPGVPGVHGRHAPEPCPRCGAIDRPLLSPGTGPHSCKATCAHCGRFLKWISLHAPAERMAHRRQARLKAMRLRPPSEAQLTYLKSLGNTQAVPATMAEASERIEQLNREKGVA